MPTVTVACKLPHGVSLALPGIKGTIEIKGPLSRFRDSGIEMLVQPTGYDYAYTEVDESFMNEWLKLNSELTFVKEKFLFIKPKQSEAQAMAKDYAAMPTKLEPYKPGANGEKPADKQS